MPPRPRPAPAGRRRAPPPGGVAITNPDKVLFPEPGITKGQLADYYRRVAGRLLPHLRDRPVTVERFPDGVGDGVERFYQKNCPDFYPPWVRRANLPTKEGKIVHYALVNDVDTLLYLVNDGAITFHVWLSRMGSLNRPDYVLFDLDPCEAGFGALLRVAAGLHAVLRKKRVKTCLKTSGKSGLHVLVPWDGRGGFEASRAWAKGIAEEVADALPREATVETRKADRGRRVFVDVLHNSRGHHVVPAYVVRPVPEASVSTPLTWRQLTAKLDPSRFTVRTLFARLARQKSDPLAPLTRLGRI
jgi:bifunctional non-homologous end joining protein LigD